jgi:hypothetical protein
MDDEEEFEVSDLAAIFGALPKVRNRRFRPIDALVLATLAAHNLSDAVTNSLAAAYNGLASHANYQRDLDDMREAATREIETLISGEDNG